MKLGIDVSSYQGVIEWLKVKGAGIKYAILKIIRKDLDPDKQFKNNLKGCFAVGMPVQGVYNYSYATNVSKAVSDAMRVIEVLRETLREVLGITLEEYLKDHELTVHLDVEDKCQEGLGELLIDIIDAYAEVIKAAGLGFGIYTGQYFYNTYIKPYGGVTHKKWIARYGKNDGTRNDKYMPNVEGISGWQYTSRGTVPGITGNVDMNIWYDEVNANPQFVITHASRQAFVDKAVSFIGVREGSAEHKEIIDIYNANKPLARGYKVKYTDSWCATFVSAIAILCGLTDIIATECSCQRQIGLFKEVGAWNEDGAMVPEAGDIIYYNWDDTTQENDGWADHVGIVEDVQRGVITVVEGNYNDSVMRREIRVGDGRIRGYASPSFNLVIPVVEKTVAEVAREVINGIWGNGEIRKAKLEAAGYDYVEVQTMVNSILKPNNPVYHEAERGDTLSGIAKQYETTVNALVELNQIQNKNLIRVGQRIRVK